MSVVRMSLEDVLTGWRPGSHDTADTPDGANREWTWRDEAVDLFGRDHERTAGVLERVALEGINFGSEYGADICLGSDGRVWDGHHRIVIAIALQIPYLLVDVA